MKRIAVVAGLFAFMSYGILADQTGDCTQGEEFCESLETTNNTTTNNTNTNTNTSNNTNVNTNNTTSANTNNNIPLL